jgi:hypothetical protein
VPHPSSEAVVASLAKRLRIWQQYEALLLTEDQATLALLRLDFAERRAKKAALAFNTP